MKYDPQRHHRRSIRLPGYDYTQPGAYFVTLVTHERRCLFGKIVAGKMHLNPWGEIARQEWFQTAVVRPYVVLRDDEWVVMPNHVHGIIWIVDDDRGGAAALRSCPDNPHLDPCTGAAALRPYPDNPHLDPCTGAAALRPYPDNPHLDPCTGAAALRPYPDNPHTNVVPGSLGAIVRAYKSAVAKRINALRGTPGASVWQRNYYEHIIRDNGELERVRQYILDNPVLWTEDREKPSVMTSAR